MIIGISGFINSGKDTVADIICKAQLPGIMQQNSIYAKHSFADKLKDAVALMYGWDRSLLQGDTDRSREWREETCPRWGVTPRKALQDVGVAMRGVDSDFWVKSLLTRFKNDSHVVIPDVRFPNEVDGIHELGGIVIRVERGEQPEWVDIITDHEIKSTDDADKVDQFLNEMGFPNIHESEWRMACNDVEFDVVIENGSDIENLEHLIEHLLSIDFDLDKFGNQEDDKGVSILDKPGTQLELDLTGDDYR